MDSKEKDRMKSLRENAEKGWKRLLKSIEKEIDDVCDEMMGIKKAPAPGEDAVIDLREVNEACVWLLGYAHVSLEEMQKQIQREIDNMPCQDSPFWKGA